MSYKVVIEKPARKFIEKQPPDQQKRILTALYKLPEQGDIFPMRGKANQYRVRIGTYRAVYNLDRACLPSLLSKWTTGETCIKVDNIRRAGAFCLRSFLAVNSYPPR